MKPALSTTTPQAVKIDTDRVPFGRYKGWYRGRIGPGTYLTPNATDTLEFQCAAKDIFDAWCKGIQRNAALKRSMPLPPYEQTLMTVLWVRTDDGAILPTYAPSQESLKQPPAGHALGGICKFLSLQASAFMLAAWLLAWSDDVELAEMEMKFALPTDDPEQPLEVVERPQPPLQ